MHVVLLVKMYNAKNRVILYVYTKGKRGVSQLITEHGGKTSFMDF